MKTSLKKLRGFASLRHGREERRHQQSPFLDEVERATQDMADLRDCYDRLFSAAAETANSAYEFSESLGEMGDCLLEKTALNDDEESGKVLLMLGKVQLELQKLVDGYRSNIFKTITIPSESLLNELRIVEEMKKQCDGKREIYMNMIKKYEEKGKSGGSRERFSSHKLQVAQEEYDEEANIFVFRMKSLKQGQSRSLLTQAARHHAAQLSFFKKALKSLEAIEPHVKSVAERQHIDYQFRGLEEGEQGGDDDDGNDEDTEDDSESHDNGELSFEYRLNGPALEVYTSKNSMELDKIETTSSPSAKLGATKENLENFTGQNNFTSRREATVISQSAPLFRDKKFDPAGRLRQRLPSPSGRFTSYVLPTPVEAKSLGSEKTDVEVQKHKQVSQKLWHSSPLNQNKYEKTVEIQKMSGSVILESQKVLKESNNNRKGNQLPTLLSDGFSFKQFDTNAAFDTRKVKRQAFSGPLTDKPWPRSPNVSATGHAISTGPPLPFSGSLPRTSLHQPSHVSPTFMSSPIISELHELPRPPAHLASKRLSNRIVHSGPLAFRGHELPAANISPRSMATSALPLPPQSISRSYSIPSGGRKESALLVPFDASQDSKMTEGNSSPSLTPISLPDIQSVPPTSIDDIHPSQVRGLYLQALVLSRT